ncbi:hypothetical protein GCM10018793_02130 [Streptomyces sulfonofaciens]|uniref:Uncharacterized protein n=1 Tax=Streptomyces sulfonofaciens TaxID=68272 RepID=A0A919KRF2_9ACTN|nr:hypothetical protein GCM10018793_02130 [Streptomyces sulfonofaciens]
MGTRLGRLRPDGDALCRPGLPPGTFRTCGGRCSGCAAGVNEMCPGRGRSSTAVHTFQVPGPSS